MNRMFSYIKRNRENEDNRHINKFTSNPKEIYSLPQFSVRTMTSPWSKGMVAIETEHAVAQFHCPGTGRADVLAGKGRC